MKQYRPIKATTMTIVFFSISILIMGISAVVYSADREVPVAEYGNYNGTDPTYALSNPDYFYDLPSRGFYRNALTPRFSWVNFFAAKMIENRDIFPWSTPNPIEEDRFDEVGGLQYELFEGEFQHVDEIRRNIVEDLFPKAAEELLKKTRTGKKLDQLSRKIASYCTVQYLKSEDDETTLYLPGHQSIQGRHLKDASRAPIQDADEMKDLYGTAFTIRPFNDVNSNPLEVAIEVNAFYLTTMTRFRYEPSEERVSFSLTDTRVDAFFDCRAALEFASEPDETFGVFRLYFNF